MRKGDMNKSYMKVKPSKKDYHNRMWEAEANVDSEFVASQPTHKVLRIEVIDGKKYKVLSI